MIESRVSTWSDKVKLHRWVCDSADCMTAGARSSGPWLYSEASALAGQRKHRKQHD
jgi:hypothetical protein